MNLVLMSQAVQLMYDFSIVLHLKLQKLFPINKALRIQTESLSSAW